MSCPACSREIRIKVKRVPFGQAVSMVNLGQFIDPKPGTLEADHRFAAFCGKMARLLELALS